MSKHKTKHSEASHAEHKEKPKEKNRIFILTSLIILLALFVIANQIMINDIAAKAGLTQSSASSSPAALTELENQIMPKGVPAIYGKEIGVSFDDVKASNPQLADETIAKLSKFDKTITLTGDKLKRYIKIASQISCEYCCGAKALIFSNGQPACGCAHSYAMRGLAKYLIDRHGNEYTDDQILEELGKWKTLFFPGNILAKAKILKDKGIELNYINLASNKYRGIERGATAGTMVGGC